MADEEKGAKWWIRYVVVPLVGGGGLIAALIAKTTPTAPPKNAEVVSAKHEDAPPIAQPAAATNSLPAKPVQSKPAPEFSHQQIKSATVTQGDYVQVLHSRDLPFAVLSLDGRKLSNGIVVEGRSGSSITTLRLLPGEHRLSANLAGKTCSVIFTVPSSGPVPFPCEVPFEENHNDR